MINNKDTILFKLFNLIKFRKRNIKIFNKSYISNLLILGQDIILKKIGEETTELILASKNFNINLLNIKNKQNLVYEYSDLLFHTLILLIYHNISLLDIFIELNRRRNCSGLIEKNNRNN